MRSFMFPISSLSLHLAPILNMFGYNNRVGIILLLILSTIGAIWTNGLNLEFSSQGPSAKIPFKYLWVGLAVEFLACSVMYLIAGRYGGFEESAYNIHRVWLVSLGKSPYIDFEWTYGSAISLRAVLALTVFCI